MKNSTENKALVREYIEKVVNTGNTILIEKYISEAYTEIHDGKAHKLGIKGAREHIQGVRKTYPDLKLTIENQIAEGEWVATIYTMTGTHNGLWLGIKPTGKKIRVTGVNIDRIKNGKIAEHGGAAGLLEPLLEVGAVKIIG
jgi:predicted ester cyclase